MLKERYDKQIFFIITSLISKANVKNPGKHHTNDKFIQEITIIILLLRLLLLLSCCDIHTTFLEYPFS